MYLFSSEVAATAAACAVMPAGKVALPQAQPTSPFALRPGRRPTVLVASLLALALVAIQDSDATIIDRDTGHVLALNIAGGLPKPASLCWSPAMYPCWRKTPTRQP